MNISVVSDTSVISQLIRIGDESFNTGNNNFFFFKKSGYSGLVSQRFVIGWNFSRYFVNQSEKRQKSYHFTQTCARVLLSIVWFSCQISVRVTNYPFSSEYNTEYFKRGKTAEKSINEQLKYFSSWLVSWTNVDSSGRRTPFEKRDFEVVPVVLQFVFFYSH